MSQASMLVFPVDLDSQDSQSSLSVSNQASGSPFSCNVCNKSYTRADHLSRHRRSHTREKPFPCDTCGKRFARADLLKRHTTAHATGKKPKKLQHSAAQLGRVAQACSSCATAKLKCADEKPCLQCLRKGIVCQPPSSNGNGERLRPQSKTGEMDSASEFTVTMLGASALPDPCQDLKSDMLHDYCPNGISGCAQYDHFPDLSRKDISFAHEYLPTPRTLSEPESAGNTFYSEISISSMLSTEGLMLSSEEPILSTDEPVLDLDESILAALFRDVMTNSSPNTSNSHEPAQDFKPSTYNSWDVFNFGIDSRFDFNDANFVWMHHHDALALDLEEILSTDVPKLQYGEQTPNVQASIKLGAGAFSKSLWKWVPNQDDSGWMELSNLSLCPTATEECEHDLPPKWHARQLGERSRDDMLATILKTNGMESGATPTITYFPSAANLSGLMQAFLHQERSKVDSWIHVPSLDPQNQTPEFNGIVVAGGAELSSVPAVRKLGCALHETIRIGIPNIFEMDNSRTRQLQYLQTYALVLQQGLWSGNKRKMEIAEAHMQGLITMLRRAGRFRRSRTVPAAPQMEDDTKALEAKWQAWIEAESWKRLAFHVIIYDAQVSISLLTRPLIAYSEVSLELPCPPSLWNSKTAHVWRNVYQETTILSNCIPSLNNCIHDLSPLSEASASIDTQYSSYIVLHAIWSLISDYRQLEFVPKPQPQGHQQHRKFDLLSSSCHQELGHLLDDFRTAASRVHPHSRPPIEQTMILELFNMNLYVSFEELQLFGGKEGAEEAQRVYPLLKSWVEGQNSRQAVWHAGQVVRAALLLPKDTLRDFYAVALYHAALAFWVYGMIRKRKNGGVDPEFGNGIEGEYVILDGPDTEEVRQFIANSRGTPVLRGPRHQDGTPQNNLVRLEQPKAVMEVVIAILKGNCSAGNAGLLPALIENLAQLVRDLGNAARIMG